MSIKFKEIKQEPIKRVQCYICDLCEREIVIANPNGIFVGDTTKVMDTKQMFEVHLAGHYHIECVEARLLAEYIAKKRLRDSNAKCDSETCVCYRQKYKDMTDDHLISHIEGLHNWR